MLVKFRAQTVKSNQCTYLLTYCKLLYLLIKNFPESDDGSFV